MTYFIEKQSGKDFISLQLQKNGKAFVRGALLHILGIGKPG